ncbi:hypothetical protein [Novosphingobium sp.]|uniref:hypothetical protein n=1 Tax=Novosphingobium sp. TaxID=1874826 RepID=UPI0038BD2999
MSGGTSGGMITLGADLAALEARLLDQARRLATAQAATIVRQGSPDRWRSAALLWPLLVQE